MELELLTLMTIHLKQAEHELKVYFLPSGKLSGICFAHHVVVLDSQELHWLFFEKTFFFNQWQSY